MPETNNRWYKVHWAVFHMQMGARWPSISNFIANDHQAAVRSNWSSWNRLITVTDLNNWVTKWRFSYSICICAYLLCKWKTHFGSVMFVLPSAWTDLNQMHACFVQYRIDLNQIRKDGFFFFFCPLNCFSGFLILLKNICLLIIVLVYFVSPVAFSFPWRAINQIILFVSQNFPYSLHTYNLFKPHDWFFSRQLC